MSEKLIRKVVVAALKGEKDDAGWINVDTPRTTAKELSLAIMEANQRGLVEGCEIPELGEEYREWKLLGPTGASRQYLAETRTSKKIWARGAAVFAAVVGFIKWVVPVIISLWKK